MKKADQHRGDVQGEAHVLMARGKGGRSRRDTSED